MADYIEKGESFEATVSLPKGMMGCNLDNPVYHLMVSAANHELKQRGEITKSTQYYDVNPYVLAMGRLYVHITRRDKQTDGVSSTVSFVFKTALDSLQPVLVVNCAPEKETGYCKEDMTAEDMVEFRAEVASYVSKFN